MMNMKLAVMALVVGMAPIAAFAEDVAKVPVITGGIGSEEEAKIEEVEHNFDLKVTFAGNNGEYLDDVSYTIARANGEVMARGTTNGPILLTQLPVGTYKVSAQFNGQQKSENVVIGNVGLRSLTMTFTAS